MTTRTTEMLGLDHPLMAEIRQLAQTAVDHRLGAQMLGDRPLTRASALMVVQRLRSKQPGTPAPEVPVSTRIQMVEPGAPRRSSFADLVTQVPPGRYAVPSATGHNDLDFYLVQPGKGKWDTRTFIRRVIGGHDPMPMSNPEQYRALVQITRFGVEEAGMKYAMESGNCRDCGRELTDEESRAAGRGPVCRSK